MEEKTGEVRHTWTLLTFTIKSKQKSICEPIVENDGSCHIISTFNYQILWSTKLLRFIYTEGKTIFSLIILTTQCEH